jgi:zinc D-Ala-D-Ala carboxypeptidase
VTRWLAVALVGALAGCATSAVPSVATSGGVPSATPDAELAADAGRGLGIERVATASAASRPDQPSLAATFRASLVADHCVDRDLAAPPTDDPIHTVLDRSYALSPTYAPTDLVAASEAGFAGASAAKLVRSALVADLAQMASAWQAAGLEISIESAYRSYASQAVTFDLWTARLGPAAALLRTARPGHSEHQLGTAIDFTSPGWSGRVGDWAAESAEGAWMAEHAWEYGFAMSYPAGAQPETCFGYEPWHYRWIGRDAADAQRASGQVLRQFLERYVGS